jgi:hypothetical protein
MVECTQPKVLERTKEKQEKQNKYQDSRNTVRNGENKRCYKEKMYCDNGYCSSNIKRYSVHYYLQRVAHIYTECEAFEVTLLVKTKITK